MKSIHTTLFVGPQNAFVHYHGRLYKFVQIWKKFTDIHGIATCMHLKFSCCFSRSKPRRLGSYRYIYAANQCVFL